jgi:hypothetical protein
MKIKTILLFMILFCVFSFSFAELKYAKYAIVVANRYKPYMDVVKGFTKSSNKNAEVFYLNDNPKRIEISLKKNKYDFIVAVGVQSLSFVKNIKVNIPIFYSLLVYPPDNMSEVCGVYLQPSPKKMSDILKKEYPDVKNIVIPATSKDSMNYIDNLREYYSEDVHIKVINLKEIKKLIVSSSVGNGVFLFIPDELFSSDILIKEIIDLVGGKFFVVGYNPFFCAVGADVCFRNDYVDIGKQSFGIVENFYKTGRCESESAKFQVIRRGGYEKK